MLDSEAIVADAINDSRHKSSSGDNDIEDVPPIGTERAEAKSEPSDDDVGGINERYDQEPGLSDLLDGIVRLRQSLGPVQLYQRMEQTMLIGNLH